MEVNQFMSARGRMLEVGVREYTREKKGAGTKQVSAWLVLRPLKYSGTRLQAIHSVSPFRLTARHRVRHDELPRGCRRILRIGVAVPRVVSWVHLLEDR